MQKVFYIGVCFYVLIFSGCAKLPMQDFNIQIHQDIKTIGIVQPAVPDEFTIYYFNHAADNATAQFGFIGSLIGSAISGTDFSSKESSYEEAIASVDFNLSQYFLQSLENELKLVGYALIVLPEPALKDLEFRKDYPEDMKVDAYLDSYIEGIGYVAGSNGSTYKATVSIKNRLIKKVDKSVVYAKSIVAGEVTGVSERAVYVGYDEKYSYQRFSDLEANAVDSIEGLKLAIQRVTKQIAIELDQRQQRE